HLCCQRARTASPPLSYSKLRAISIRTQCSSKRAVEGPTLVNKELDLCQLADLGRPPDLKQDKTRRTFTVAASFRPIRKCAKREAKTNHHQEKSRRAQETPRRL